MTDRVPLVDDGAAIRERLAEIQAERLAAIAGHPPQPQPPSQIEQAMAAMARARARLRQAGVPIREPEDPRLKPSSPRWLPSVATVDDIIERAIAAKYARHRVLS